MSSSTMIRLVAPGLMLLTTSGCSLLFVNGPPAGHEQALQVSCTESNAVLALDAVWAGLNGLGAAMAASADDGTYENPQQAVVIGGAWFVVSSLSAREGFRRTKSCRSAKEQLAIRQYEARRSDAISTATQASFFDVGSRANAAHFTTAVRMLAPLPVRFPTLSWPRGINLMRSDARHNAGIESHDDQSEVSRRVPLQ